MGEARCYPASEPKAVLGVWKGGELEKKGRKKWKVWRALGGEGRALRSLVFFIIQNPPDLGELQNCNGGGFRGVWVNFPNSICIVRILA